MKNQTGWLCTGDFVFQHKWRNVEVYRRAVGTSAPTGPSVCKIECADLRDVAAFLIHVAHVEGK